MRRLSMHGNSNSTLPTLKTSAKHSHSRESVKNIQTRINLHDNQITRNQKVIISLTNDFRLLKDDLNAKVKENDQITSMHTKTLQDNQRLIKLNKQLRQNVMRMQKITDDKHNSSLKQQHMEKIKNLQNQLNTQNTELSKSIKMINVLETNNQQLIKENDRLTDEIRKQNKILSDKVKSAQYEKQLKTSVLNQQIRQLKQLISQKQKIVKKQDDEIEKLKQNLKKKEKQSKELLKLDKNYKELRIHYEKALDENKNKKVKIQQLEKEIECFTERNSNENEKMWKFEQKQGKLLQKIDGLEKLKHKITNDNRELSKQVDQMKKSSIKLNKLMRIKSELLKSVQVLSQSVKCDLCTKILEKPVTSIPCGHSFCLDCKKGYEKQCKKCVAVKRQAVYRNELLDELINGYKVMQKISEHLVNQQ